jgi:hypothetical protein
LNGSEMPLRQRQQQKSGSNASQHANNIHWCSRRRIIHQVLFKVLYSQEMNFWPICIPRLQGKIERIEGRVLEKCFQWKRWYASWPKGQMTEKAKNGPMTKNMEDWKAKRKLVKWSI